MDVVKHIQDLSLSVENGHADAADTYAHLYNIKKALDECMAMVKESAVDEVKKYGKEGVVKMGLLLTTKAAAGRWNYSGVAVHSDLSKKLKQVEELAQAAYRTGASIANDDGELITPATYLAGADTVVCTKAK